MKIKQDYHILQGFLFLLIILSTFALAVPLQREIRLRMDVLKTESIALLEHELGRKVSFSGISPSLFRFIEIRDLVIHGAGSDAGSETLFRIRKLKVYYRLWDLLRGDLLNAFTEIRIENSRLAFDTERDADLIALLHGRRERSPEPQTGTEGTPGSGGPASGTTPGNDRRLPFLKEGMSLSGRNLSLQVTSPRGTIQTDRLFFTARSEAGRFTLTARGGVAARKPETTVPEPFSRIDGSLRLWGSVDRDLAWSDLTLRVDDLRSGELELRSQTFHGSLQDDVWIVRKIQDREPIDLTIQYDMNAAAVEVSYRAQRFEPARLFRLRNAGEPVRALLRSRLSGSGTVGYRLADRSLDLRGTLTAEELGVRGKNYRLDAAFSGSDRMISFDRLSLRVPEGEILFDGTFSPKTLLPAGRLRLRDIPVTEGVRLGGTVLIDRRDGGIIARSGDLRFGEALLPGTEITVNREAEGFSLSGLFRFAGAAAADTASDTTAATAAADTDERSSVETADAGESEESVLHAEGFFVAGSEPMIQLLLDARAVPSPQLYQIAALLAGARPIPAVRSFLTGYRVDTEIFFSSDFRRVSLTVPDLTLADTGTSGNRISLRLLGTGDYLRIDGIEGFVGGEPLSGNLRAERRNDGTVRFATELQLQDVPYHLEGNYLPGSGVSITGSYGIVMNLFAGSDRDIRFRLNTGTIPLPARAEGSFLSLDVEGFYAGPASWEAVAEQITVTGVSRRFPQESTLSVSGWVAPGRGRITRVTYRDRISELTGSGDILISFDGPPEAEGFLSLRDSEGTETYETSFVYSRSAISGSIVFGGSRLARYLPGIIEGSADGRVQLSGSPSAPTFRGDLQILDASFQGDPVSLEAAFSLDDSALSLRIPSASFRRHRISGFSAGLDRENGSFTAALRYNREGAGEPLKAAVQLDGEFRNEGGILGIGELQDRGFSARMSVADISLNGTHIDPWTLAFMRMGDLVTVNGGPGESISGWAERNGRFSLEVRDPMPVTFRGSGTVSGGNVDAVLDRVSLRTAVFSEQVSFPLFEFTDGQADGELRIFGPVNDPDFQGILHVRNGAARSSLSPDPIGPFNTSLEFRNKEMIISRFSTRTGAGSIEAEGSIMLDHWEPFQYRIFIDTVRRGGVRIASTFGPVEVDGYGFGHIEIVGDNYQLDIGGAFTVSDCIVAIDEDAEAIAAAARPGQQETVVSLSVTTGKQVEFVWPNRRFPVLSSIADTGEKLEIRYDSTTENFSLKGDIDIRGGDIYYFDRSFFLREGNISFNENQDRFDPLLTARAERRETSQEGPVKLYLVVEKERLSEFSPRFEADPPLPQSTVLAMLGRNVLDQYGTDDTGITSAFLLTSDVLAQFGFMRSIERSVQSVLPVDMFSIRTHVVQNVLRDNFFKTNPDPLDNSGSSLGKYLDNTTLFLGKYLGSDLFLEALVQFRSAEPALPDIRNQSGIAVDWELSLEWKTPFFLLDWSFVPRSPEDLFITDNTFTFSWKYSY